MRTASLRPEVTLMDNEDMNEVSGDDDWQFVSLGEQQNFGIRTAGVYWLSHLCNIMKMFSLSMLLFLLSITFNVNLRY